MEQRCKEVGEGGRSQRWGVKRGNGRRGGGEGKVQSVRKKGKVVNMMNEFAYASQAAETRRAQRRSPGEDRKKRGEFGFIRPEVCRDSERASAGRRWGGSVVVVSFT